MGILESIKANCIRNPERVAISYAGKYISYKEMLDSAVRLAAIICGEISHDNSPVVILMNRGEEFVISMLAIMLSGNYFVPLELPQPEERVRNILTQLKDSVVIIENDVVLEKYRGCNMRKVIKYYTKTETRHIDNEVQKIQECPNNICYVIFTSGTSGKAKGVKIKYYSLENLVFNFLNRVYSDINGNAVVGVLSSFSFDASLKQIFGAFVYGHTLCIARKEEKMFSNKLQHFLWYNNIYVVDGTPSIYKILLMKKKKLPITVKYFLIGGEILKWELVNNLYEYLEYEPIIVNVYGPTECCIDASSYWIYECDKEKNGVVPIGKPICNANFEIKELITESKGVGELYISGVLVGDGYIGEDSNTSFFYDKSQGIRTYRTGDICFVNEKNDYVMVGRYDQQVKVNGNRIEIKEIENCIQQYEKNLIPIVGVTSIRGMEEIFLVFFGVERYEDRVPMLKYLKTKLPDYCLPKYIICINDEIPLTTNGKINRQKIQDLFEKLLSKKGEKNEY